MKFNKNGDLPIKQYITKKHGARRIAQRTRKPEDKWTANILNCEVKWDERLTSDYSFTARRARDIVKEKNKAFAKILERRCRWNTYPDDNDDHVPDVIIVYVKNTVILRDLGQTSVTEVMN